MNKHGILKQYYPDQWNINLGGAAYLEVTAGVSFIEVLDVVSDMGWEVVSVKGEEEALVTMPYEDYRVRYGEDSY